MAMNIYILGLIAFAVIAFGYVVSLYNWLQTALTRINASIQDIGNQLKRQSSLIPNLETSAKSYLKHEKDIYDSLTSARKAVEGAQGGDMKKVDKASEALTNLIPKLHILVESNPELKAEKVITKLMDELTDTSDKLTYARRVVIDLTADFNQKLVVFPSNLIAGWFGFKPQKGIETATVGAHLSVSDEEMKDTKISL